MNTITDKQLNLNQEGSLVEIQDLEALNRLFNSLFEYLLAQNMLINELKKQQSELQKQLDKTDYDLDTVMEHCNL